MQSQAQQYLGDFSRPFFPKAGQSELSLLYRNISVNSKDEQSGIPIEIDGNISGIRADYNYGLSDSMLFGMKVDYEMGAI